LWGYLDRNGEVAIDIQYSSAEAFSGGLAVVSNTEGNYGVIDTNGKTIIPFNYESILISDGNIIVTVKDDATYLVDKKNKIRRNKQV
jgi:hypothetical protein